MKYFFSNLSYTRTGIQKLRQKRLVKKSKFLSEEKKTTLSTNNVTKIGTISYHSCELDYSTDSGKYVLKINLIADKLYTLSVMRYDVHLLQKNRNSFFCLRQWLHYEQN